MTKHSKVGASAAKRWLACPVSVNLSEKVGADPYLKQDPSEEAEDGTFAHAVLEWCLKEQDFQLSDVVSGVAHDMQRVPPGWVEDVVEGALDVLSPYLSPPYSYWAEQKVVFAPAYDGFGTLDFAAWKPGRLIVADLKTGVGVRVTAEMNPQMLCYAWGWINAHHDKPVNVVELIVIQPRVPGGITRYELTRQALEDWKNNVLYPGLSNTQNAKPVFKVGEHCRFCPALVHCPEQNKTTEGLLSQANAMQPGFHPAPKTTEWVLENAPIIRKYLAEVERYALKKALAGNPPLGYKVVAGKANRTWRDGSADILEALFGPDAYEAPKLKSPAQVEAFPGGKDIALQFAYSPQGAPTLAPETDTRPTFTPPDFKQLFKGSIDA